ncbi:MAG TPA: DUF4290 domain-containing protein [Cyclobacteriaceae bacterium]|nr:DUF4290 domain-containing protein [Cyclobacteriaceae bacterium]
MIGEYNSARPQIILKEYGRNVQKLMEYIKALPSKEERTKAAYTLVELMKQLSPAAKEHAENDQRFWDDLYIIADFELDIDSPFPVPEKEVIFSKPNRMSYPQSPFRFKHYGKNIELLVKEALKKEETKERDDAIIYLGKLMKTFYANWNKETLDDNVILQNLQQMIGSKIDLDIDKIKEDNLFEKLCKDRKRPNQPHKQGKGGKFKGKNMRRRRD